jgi:hypothetical protein
MSEQPGSRIADAKLRVTTAKHRLGVAAVATFVGLLGLAWASHPGKATTSGTQDTGFARRKLRKPLPGFR